MTPRQALACSTHHEARPRLSGAQLVREAQRLFFDEGRSTRDVARALGVTQRAVKILTAGRRIG